jgi:hypothetical protein
MVMNTLITGNETFRDLALNMTLERTPEPVIVRPGGTAPLSLDHIQMGTLVIDNVDQLSEANQSALMTWLDASPVRVVSVAGRPLFDHVQAHRFRADLYYRICTEHVCPEPDMAS